MSESESKTAVNLPTEEQLRKKAARKARPGGSVKWINIPRNWAHQALSYMDSGELSFRVLVQTGETLLVWAILNALPISVSPVINLLASVFIVHTWNWVTNCLFWSVIIFTFPGLRNPGAVKTVEYLNDMRERLKGSRCISGIAVYGSVTRQTWHDRSDIDIRLLRRKGFSNWVCAGMTTMAERWRAMLALQPMDLYLADDVDFLLKMRSDEIPVLLLARDERMKRLYADNDERPLTLRDLLGDAANAASGNAAS